MSAAPDDPRPPAAGGAADRKAVRETLAAAGYDEAGVVARLGLRGAREVLRRLAAVRVGAAAPDPGHDALGALVAVLLLGRRLPVDTLRRRIGASAVEALTAVSLLRAEGDEAGSQLLLFPCRGHLFATDGLEPPGVGNPVMPLYPESYDLAALTPREPVARALDLCTGSGIHALLAARHTREVTAVDVSPRALAFARFNAWLNDVGNVDFRLGDLYGPVGGDPPFDLVTANPPYNPEVASAAGENFHSGGESGEEILAGVVAGLPASLSRGGQAQVITLLVHREGDEPAPRLVRWLGGAQMDVLVLSRPVDYRPVVLRGGPQLEDADRALHESWRRQRIRAFSFGLLHLRRTPSGRRPVVSDGPFGSGLEGPPDVRPEDLLEAASRAGQGRAPAPAAGLGRPGP